MSRDVLVKEAMRARPLTCSALITVREVARLMREYRVGSSIITMDNQPIGIVTESDILKKVVAEGRDANKIVVKDIMTSPLIAVDPYITIEDAMKIMNKHNIRRLPVIEEGKLVGIITEKDIFRISPALMEISKEWSTIECETPSAPSASSVSGKCEGCGRLSNDLKEVDGRFLCEDCREE